ENDGLGNDTVYGILEDNAAQLWLSTNKGLSRFDPVAQVFRNYDESDGLQSNEFNSGAAFRSNSGELFFGGINGYNHFFAENITDNPNVPPVVLTDFLMFNQSVAIFDDGLGDDEVNPFKLTKSITHSDNLELAYTHSMISFAFSALNFQNADKNRYAYKMQGYDQSWITTDSNKRLATYTNLDSGNYVFRVKASNNDGLWNEQGVAVNILITPPWWRSNLAYAAYLLLGFSSIYGFIVFRTRVLTQRAQSLEKAVTERTAEVEQLLSLRDQDFANVSHEFRTPLTLILGPIAQLLATKRPTEEIKQLKVVQRSGYRLLRMVDQLLNLESFRVKSINPQNVLDFATVIGNIVGVFSDIAKDKKLQLTITQLEPVHFAFTKDALDNIIFNLLSNAIKYTPSGGRITVCSKRTDNNELMIAVEDSGIGIAKQMQSHIFERFARVEDEKTEQVAGTGIGLALVKEIVEVHQGRIEVQSEPANGSTFRVYLPIVNEVSGAQGGKPDTQGNRPVDEEFIRIEQQNLIAQMPITPASSHNPNPGHNTAAQKPLIERDVHGTHVLIVEDNPDMRQYLVDCIGEHYHVDTAINGEQGFNTATSQVPDIIISDIMMPVMDGLQMTRQLKEQSATSHIPVILLTALSDKKHRMQGLLEHATEYLVKPFDADELLLHISNVLAIQVHLRQRFVQELQALNPNTTILTRSPDADAAPAEPANIATDKRLAAEHEFVKRLNSELDKNYLNADFNVTALAEKLFISRQQLTRKVKALMAMLPSDYLWHYRLEKAVLLLKQGVNAGDVAFMVGYASHSSFSQSFKAKYGISPTDT
ncbi:MAG: ATP-binding protein, partial [Psychrosphaera sp.]|nr:ATP-binding protein [Psychrosphaera sp.]